MTLAQLSISNGESQSHAIGEPVGRPFPENHSPSGELLLHQSHRPSSNNENSGSLHFQRDQHKFWPVPAHYPPKRRPESGIFHNYAPR